MLYTQAVCASIVLAMDLLQRPHSPEAAADRGLIQGALVRIAAHGKVSVSLTSPTLDLSVFGD